ncbi:MAG: carboxymethylenebutenolidase, partial [Pseudomonadota bacterium]
MCDDLTAADDAALMSRRDIGLLAAGAGLALLIPSAANALPVRASTVSITTPDGVCDAYFVHPAKGKHPAVLIWPDIKGLRPAFELMGKRLAEAGYAVLVINPFYRVAKAPVVGPNDDFQMPAVRAKLMPMAQALSAKTTEIDAAAFVHWLDAQRGVDKKRKIGTIGYCMGGPMTFHTAALLPERIGAIGSFHGGGLATDKPDSPHHLVSKMKASALIAIADNDNQRDPGAKLALRSAFDAANLPAEIEVYTG